jgi:hypothetical protein
MPRCVALHDRRLEGGVPNRPNLTIINTDGHTCIQKAFVAINAVARSGKIHTLFVLCHGYTGLEVDALNRSDDDAGSGELELGKDDLNLSNVSSWKAIADAAENIVVYSCSAADTQPGFEGTSNDGRRLMGTLALYTGATVFAADQPQDYDTFKDLKNGCFEFGQWEGTLWQFLTDGSPPKAVLEAPIEFDDFMNGVRVTPACEQETVSQCR